MTKRIALTVFVVYSIVVMTACDKNMGDHDDSGNRTFELSGAASGSQMQPATSSSGTASITGTYNANTNLLNYQIIYSNLYSAAVSGSFYSKTDDNSEPTGIAWHFSGSSNASSGNYYGMVTLTAGQETQLLANQFYYVLHTGHHAGGEVRGQVIAKLRN
jgi:hypothetical protein